MRKAFLIPSTAHRPLASVTLTTSPSTSKKSRRRSVYSYSFVFVNIFDGIPKIFYPINNTAVGGGSDRNIVFKANSQTNFTFPFTLSYNASEDTSGAIISDLASKCGAKGGTTSDLVINYKINVSVFSET